MNAILEFWNSLQAAWMYSDVGQLAYLPYAAVVYGLHMQYCHCKEPVGKGLTFATEILDLFGFIWNGAILRHFFADEAWMQWVLIGAFVIHAVLGAGWLAVSWPTLEDFMVKFRLRQMHPMWWISDLIYEQTDSALSILAMAMILLRQPPVVAWCAIAALSILIAWTIRRTNALAPQVGKA